MKKREKIQDWKPKAYYFPLLLWIKVCTGALVNQSAGQQPENQSLNVHPTLANPSCTPLLSCRDVGTLSKIGEPEFSKYIKSLHWKRFRKTIALAYYIAREAIHIIFKYLVHNLTNTIGSSIKWGPCVNHSMARAKLNKSKKVLNYSTTTASKYIPKRTRICINWNPPFQIQIYLVKVPLNVNIVKQDLLNKKQFKKNLCSYFWKGGFQLIQILGLLGMYFGAVVVEVMTFLLLVRLALAILWNLSHKKMKKWKVSC